MLRTNEEVGVVFGAQPPLSLPEFAFIHKERKLGVLISIWHSLNNLGFLFLGAWTMTLQMNWREHISAYGTDI